MSDPRILSREHVERIRRYEPDLTTQMWSLSHEVLRRELDVALREVSRLREALDTLAHWKDNDAFNMRMHARGTLDHARVPAVPQEDPE